MSELQELISAQADDQRNGDRVYSLSLDADVFEGVARIDTVTTDDLRDEGYLKPRNALKVKPLRGLVRHRQRNRQRKRMYGGICESCGAVTDGSNGKAKAPSVCLKCLQMQARAAMEALPHGVIQKYRAGCRCKPCRWANSRQSWDYHEKKRAER